MSACICARSLALATLVTSSLVVGCVVQNGSSGSSGSPGSSGGGGSTETPTDDAGTGSGSSSNAPSSQPMLVVVDSNETMSASPGQGVGVFTQYQTGGHWNVWWTCDTDKSSLPCAFDITASVMSGTIENVAGQALQRTDALNQPSTQEIEATTTTTTTVEGVTFDTVVPSGDTPIVTVTVKLSGEYDPSYFFFVQDGKIKGGYTGSLTDPLMFQPSSP